MSDDNSEQPSPSHRPYPPRIDLGLTYEEALHGMQTGVAYEMTLPGDVLTTPKHLRVGITSAMISEAAIVDLLVAKGVFTRAEFMERLRLVANEEVFRYEATHGITFR